MLSRDTMLQRINYEWLGVAVVTLVCGVGLVSTQFARAQAPPAGIRHI